MVRWRPNRLARLASVVWMALAAVAVPLSAFAAEDTGVAGPTFKEGDVVGFDKIESIKNFVPAEFWANRDFFFYEGMNMEVGPFFKDYGQPPEYLAASEKFKGQAKVGPDDSLEGFSSGFPFDPASIDCKGDPQAGVKHIWNFAYQWDGDGSDSRYFYSYWDRGEELPLYYEGTSKTIMMSHRVEPELVEKQAGDLFRGEKRVNAFGIEVDAPFDARGILLMSYRYKDSEKPVAQAKNDDTWVYVPTLRRVRRISTAQRTDAISGTDFTLDDLFSFNGVVPQYEWKCLGEQDVITPFNTKVKGYPYVKDQNFGPYGLSFANDRWELRRAVIVRMTPRNKDHPYAFKDIYIDKETLQPLYSFAYDQKQELWKILYHNHRWSGDDSLTGKWHDSWEEVAEPRVMSVVADVIINVQTGTGNRIEIWDAGGKPVGNKAQIRRYIDVGRLTRGR